LIFHYHYQWNKRDERQRNEVAIREHVTYIEALLSRNRSMVELACRAHLTSARETLIRATAR
jgi:DNA-binding GntR family transcriptional regulator